MMSNIVKIAILIALIIVTLGVLPDRQRGALLAIATCIVAAVVIHFVVP